MKDYESRIGKATRISRKVAFGLMACLAVSNVPIIFGEDDSRSSALEVRYRPGDSDFDLEVIGRNIGNERFPLKMEVESNGRISKFEIDYSPLMERGFDRAVPGFEGNLNSVRIRDNQGNLVLGGATILPPK